MSATAIVLYALIAICVTAHVVFIVAMAIRGDITRLLRERDAYVDKATAKRTYAPEVIDPRPRQRRGGCGVLGCPNVRPHSHVADLMRRLKEPRQ